MSFGLTLGIGEGSISAMMSACNLRAIKAYPCFFGEGVMMRDASAIRGVLKVQELVGFGKERKLPSVLTEHPVVSTKPPGGSRGFEGVWAGGLDPGGEGGDRTLGTETGGDGGTGQCTVFGVYGRGPEGDGAGKLLKRVDPEKGMENTRKLGAGTNRVSPWEKSFEIRVSDGTLAP